MQNQGALKTGDFPKFHSFNGTFSFVHWFGAGGKQIGKLFKDNSTVFIEPVPDSAYDPNIPQNQRKKLARSKVHFLIRGVKVIFRTILHRPIPVNAVVKKAIITHNQSGRNEKWNLVITVEIPPEDMPVIHTPERKDIAAIDVGFRVIGDNIRIGVFVDSTGRIEHIYLPKKKLIDPKQPVNNKDISFIDINNYIHQLQSQKDMELERVKYVTRKVLSEVAGKIPQEYKDILNNWHLARQKRLYRIIRMLRETKLDDRLLEVLIKWKYHNITAMEKINGTSSRMIRHREHFYRNLALDLCKRYSKIVVEKINLSYLAVKESPDGEASKLPQKAGDYRKVAAISTFFSSLDMMSRKTNCEIIKDNPKNSTRECNNCGNINKPDNPGKLIWECEYCGDKWDQDENAGKVLLGRYIVRPDNTTTLA
jgi:transposase